MAGRAGAGAAIGINAAHATVGPGSGAEFSFAQILHLTAVALPALALHGRCALNNLTKNIVERPDELRGLGVAAVLILIHFCSVAAGAIFWSHDDRDLLTIMVKGGRVVGVCLMAGVAVYALFRVPAGAPLLHEDRSASGMTVEACLTFSGDLQLCRCDVLPYRVGFPDCVFLSCRDKTGTHDESGKYNEVRFDAHQVSPFKHFFLPDNAGSSSKTLVRSSTRNRSSVIQISQWFVAICCEDLKLFSQAANVYPLLTRNQSSWQDY